jgi:hypothetical protein
MNRTRWNISVRIGLAVVAALLAVQFSTGKASAQQPFNVYIAPTGLVDHGTATVSGALVATDPFIFDLWFVQVTVTQRLNGKVTVAQYAFQGSFSSFSTSIPWSVTLVPASGGFKSGYATVSVDAFSQTYGEATNTRDVLLRPR